jgi:hypothetical protein
MTDKDTISAWNETFDLRIAFSSFLWTFIFVNLNDPLPKKALNKKNSKSIKMIANFNKWIQATFLHSNKFEINFFIYLKS